jgi:hypothetical protein
VATSSIDWVDKQIPSAVGFYRQTSDEDEYYNCIAWAANESAEWWSHLPGYKWPATRSPLISALVDVFVGLGFEIQQTKNSSYEVGIEKIALYEKRGMWTHAARQLPSGKWTSKLGADEDIEHDNPECLHTKYGNIYCIMRKADHEP